MNEKFRIPSEVIRVRSHFLVKLQNWQWAIAKHAIAAGEAEDDETIYRHLKAAQVDLSNVAESGHVLGFPQLSTQANQVGHLIGLFLERCLGAPNSHKLLTDVIMDINSFIAASRKLTDQPTVLGWIDLPFSVKDGEPAD